jgi:hypothetical protein
MDTYEKVWNSYWHRKIYPIQDEPEIHHIMYLCHLYHWEDKKVNTDVNFMSVAYSTAYHKVCLDWWYNMGVTFNHEYFQDAICDVMRREQESLQFTWMPFNKVQLVMKSHFRHELERTEKLIQRLFPLVSIAPREHPLYNGGYISKSITYLHIPSEHHEEFQEIFGWIQYPETQKDEIQTELSARLLPVLAPICMSYLNP